MGYMLETYVNLTVRLQIVYSRLSVRSVWSAFEESVGSRLQIFGGPDYKELLHVELISKLYYYLVVNLFIRT